VIQLLNLGNLLLLFVLFTVLAIDVGLLRRFCLFTHELIESRIGNTGHGLMVLTHRELFQTSSSVIAKSEFCGVEYGLLSSESFGRIEPLFSIFIEKFPSMQSKIPLQGPFVLHFLFLSGRCARSLIAASMIRPNCA
jgi:hypothetical protein